MLVPPITIKATAIALSCVAHVALAVATLTSGHAAAFAGVTPAQREIELDVEDTVAVAAAEVERADLPEARPARAVERAATPPTHSHPYPVAPDHDVHPHDPHLEHPREAPAVDPYAGAPTEGHAETVAAPASTGGEVNRGAGGSASGSAATPSFDLGNGGTAASRTPDAATIFPASGVSVAARPVTAVKPAYPADARADGVEGEVLVSIVVDASGAVIDARVVRAAGHGFDAAALAAVRRFRFSPAQVDGRAVRVRMPWTIRFQLE